MLISSYIFVSLTGAGELERIMFCILSSWMSSRRTVAMRRRRSMEISSIRKGGSGNFSEDLLEFIQEGGKRGGVCRHFWPESSKIFV